MTIRINKRLSTTVNDVLYLLQKHTDKGGVYFDLDRIIDYTCYYTEQLKPKQKYWASLVGKTYLEITKDNDVIEALVNYFKLPTERITKRNPKGDYILSLSSDIRDSLIEDTNLDENIRHFLEVYRELKDISTILSSLKAYLVLPLSPLESFEGHRMVVAKPSWRILSTGRFSASNPSIQNINRDLADIITYPKNYTLVRADSSQIEPRIIYSWIIHDELIIKLINLYNDAYYGLYHFVTLDEQQEHELRTGIMPLEKKEISKDQRNELKFLANAVNYGSSSSQDKADPYLADAFVSKIQKHPHRLELDRKIREDVNRGVDTFYSYFGTPITPDSTTKYEKDGLAWKNHLIRAGLNNPIQATAADLMCESVYQADKLLESGSGKSWIGYYKHDEGCFYVHDDDKHLIEDLEGCLSYQVQDWILIPSEAEIGKKKGIESVPCI